jgi:glycosyltransferase involved in cell wall biosynthesis
MADIVHLIARLNDGGPVRVIAALARMLPELRHHVLTGGCPPGETDAAALVADAGAIVERLPGMGRLPAWGDGIALAATQRRLRALRPALLHTHTAKAGLLGRIAAQWTGVRCLHTYHGHVLHGYFPPVVHAGIAWAERRCAGRHHHHALTPAQHADLAVRHRIGAADRWHILPIPVAPPPRLPRPGGPEPVVGFLGRLAPVKDIGLWLATVRAIQARRAVAGLVCGDGHERASAQTMAPANVVFTGMVPAGAALARMDVLLMTSRNEGLPVAAVEAMALGVPVVAPPVGGLVDLIAAGAVHGAERNPAALADAVLAALAAGPAPGADAYAAALAPDALAGAWRHLYQSASGGIIGAGEPRRGLGLHLGAELGELRGPGQDIATSAGQAGSGLIDRG